MIYEVEYWLDSIGLTRAYYHAQFDTFRGAKNFCEDMLSKDYGALVYKRERMPA